MRWRARLFLCRPPSSDITTATRRSLPVNVSAAPLLPQSTPTRRMTCRPPCPSPICSSSHRHHQRLRNITSSFTSSSSSPLPSAPPPPSMASSLPPSLTSLPIDDSAQYPFGPHRLPGPQLFFLTPLSYASVNLAPVVPGHALICPRRAVLRVGEMTVEELTDCWTVAQAVGVMLTRHLRAPALTFAIQDGKEAGQSVPHVSAPPQHFTHILLPPLSLH